MTLKNKLDDKEEKDNQNNLKSHYKLESTVRSMRKYSL